MVKTKKRSLKVHNKKKIKDPQFSKQIHKGTLASKASINYEYQDYDNIIDTLELIVDESAKLKKEVKFFKGDPINAFLTLDLYRSSRKPFGGVGVGWLPTRWQVWLRRH